MRHGQPHPVKLKSTGIIHSRRVTRARTPSRFASAIVAVLILDLASGLLAVPAAASGTSSNAAPGSVLIPCNEASNRVTVTADSHLDPACTYTGGFDITASGVEFDCRGALIEGTALAGYGIAIRAPVDVGLSDIVVRNCSIRRFMNSVRVTRSGFKSLAEGHEYENAFSGITIEDSTFSGSKGTGVFVDGYVTGVTLRNLDISGAGSVGVYLEAGSKDNVVEDSSIHDNGFDENGPDGQAVTMNGIAFRFWGTGREGMAIDGSRFNRITGNTFSGNSAGGIFLYKNCGEFTTQRPDAWWPRRYGADGNLIEGNHFVGGRNGVWVGSRMAENLLPMDCSDPAYISGEIVRIHLDHAKGNTIRKNIFEAVTYGIRVEDDGTRVESNTFSAADPAHHAVIVGTKYRTEALGLPVAGTTITANRSAIAGNSHPYRWIHAPVGTAFGANRALDTEVGWCEGRQPPINPFVFVIAFAVDDPEHPPAMPDLTTNELGALEPCPVDPSTEPATPVTASPSFTG